MTDYFLSPLEYLVRAHTVLSDVRAFFDNYPGLLSKDYVGWEICPPLVAHSYVLPLVQNPDSAENPYGIRFCMATYITRRYSLQDEGLATISVCCDYMYRMDNKHSMNFADMCY